MQKRLIQSQWSFHKAGQGCFYSGQINTRGSRAFTFVYDCGTKQGTSELKIDINHYKLTNKQQAIDLLVISHLDHDHVSEIATLLDGFKCEVAVLPYFQPIERLYLYLQATITSGISDDNFTAFLQNPIQFLVDRNTETVVLIDGNGEGNTSDDVNNIRPDGPNEGNEDDQFLYIDDRLEETNLRDLDSDQEEILKTFNGHVKFKKGNGDIRVGRYWQFHFYQIKQPLPLLKTFRKKLEVVTGKPLGQHGLSDSALRDMFSDDKLLKNLKTVFRNFFKTTNETGLVVLHGPLSQSNVSLITSSALHHLSKCFTLLNGDTNMSNPYSSFIQTRIPFVKVFQIPHHGSKVNWKMDSIKTLTNGHLVANYGTKNSHRHPAIQVRDDVKKMSPFWKFYDNTEYSSFDYYILSYIQSLSSYSDTAPLHLKHKPIIETRNARIVDEQINQGRSTDVRALSIGRAHWDDPDAFSVKVWRESTNGWSRQSEELPLHRSLDLSILLLSTMINQKTGGPLLQGHLNPEIIDHRDLQDLFDFIDANRGILEERLLEIRNQLNWYFSL